MRISVDYRILSAAAIFFAISLGADLSSVASCRIEMIAFQKESNLFGDWTGDSVCQVKNSPCHDEKVVYHISKGKGANHVSVSADKIVDGKPVNMGTIDFTYEPKEGTLVSDDHGHWEFAIKGNRMEGTLSLPDKTLYRKVTLTKKGD